MRARRLRVALLDVVPGVRAAKWLVGSWNTDTQMLSEAYLPKVQESQKPRPEEELTKPRLQSSQE